MGAYHPKSILLVINLSLLIAFHTRGQVRTAFELSRVAYAVARTHPDSSVRLGEEALRVAIKAQSLPEQARAQAVLGRSAIFRGDLASLTLHVAAGLPLAYKSHNDTLLSDLYNLSGLDYRFRHRPDLAFDALKHAESYARRGKLTTQLTNVLMAKAALLIDKRQYTDALAAYEECYRISYQQMDVVGQAMASQNMGGMLFRLRRPYAALDAFKKAIALQRRENDKHGLIGTLTSMGAVFNEQGKLDSVEIVLEEAYKLAASIRDLLAQGAVANNLSTNAEQRGEAEQTRYWGRLAVKHYYATGDSAQASSALGNLGDAERSLGHMKEAEHLLSQSIVYAEQLGDARILADNLKMLGLVYQDQGRAAQAAPLFLRYSQLQDSLYKRNLAEKVDSLQNKIVLFARDRRIDSLESKSRIDKLNLQQADLREQRGSLLTLVVVLILISAVGMVHYKAKRRRLTDQAQHERVLRREQTQRFTLALSAEERERKRIAQDLHDGLGQMLTSVQLNLSMQSGPEHRFADLELMMSETLDEVRFISHNLTPQAMEHHGVDVALHEFCNRIAKTKKINLMPHMERVGHLLASESAVMLYRVVQELVSNALKHAGATELYLTIVELDGDVVLTVEDNGVGFDPAILKHKEGIGLKNLKERVDAVGGEMEIDSQLGKGAMFIIALPISHRD